MRYCGYYTIIRIKLQGLKIKSHYKNESVRIVSRTERAFLHILLLDLFAWHFMRDANALEKGIYFLKKYDIMIKNFHETWFGRSKWNAGIG